MTTTDWALVLTAVFTGIGTIITAYAGLVTAKKESSKECHEALAAARTEAESYAAELHKMRLSGGTQ